MNSWIELPFEKIFLYTEEHDDLNPRRLKKFLKEKVSCDVVLKGDFFQEKYHEGLEERIAETRVREKTKRVFLKPLPKEIEIENKIIKDGRNISGIIYDGIALTALMRDLLDREEKREHTVVITKRSLGTLEMNENRYHVRAVLASVPSSVSITGIVEGPAKPRAYYLAGKKEKENTSDFRPMQYSDERMESAVRSYLLQTIFWRLMGAPFCSKKGCRLYNSHWQKELMDYQVKGELCGDHEDILRCFRER